MILVRSLITNCIYAYNPMLSWYYLTMLYLHNRVHDARLTAIIRSRRMNGVFLCIYYILYLNIQRLSVRYILI